MARDKPPSFDFYPDDFMAGTMGMHPMARGIYITLLCYQWSHGAIPDPSEVRTLSQITGAMPDELEEHLPQVLIKFEESEGGLLQNPRLVREWHRKVEIRAKRAEAAAKGGRPKKPNGYAKGNQMVMQKDMQNESKKKPKQEVGSWKKEVGSKSKEASADDWVIPDRLDTPEVRQALADFAAMRRKIGKPIKSYANTSRVFKHFDSPEHLAYAADLCASSEYQGLKPDYRPPRRQRAAVGPGQTHDPQAKFGDGF